MTKFIKPLAFAIAIAFAGCAFAATVQTARMGALHPKNGIVVTNVTFDAAPGDYANVSNRAVNALSRAEAEAGFTEWELSGLPSGASSLLLEWLPDIFPEHPWYIVFSYNGYAVEGSDSGDKNATNLVFNTNYPESTIVVTATRTRIPTMADIAAATNALSGSLSSAVSAASAASTNYTDAAIIAATNGIPRITPADELDWPAGWAANAAWADRSGFADNASYGLRSYELMDPISGEERESRKIFAQLDAATETNAEQSAALAAMPAAVTNIVRDLSLGGIWDAALEVWWTPRMRNGSLTYEATTNVNLNAGN